MVGSGPGAYDRQGIVFRVFAELVVLVAVLTAATAFGLVRRRTDGRLKRQARPDTPRLTAADLGVPLGSRATIVQFSTPYCQVCRPTRRMLEEIAAAGAGVRYVEVFSEERFALVRRLGVLRTPTVLVLDREGRIVRRGSGQPNRANVLQAVNEAV
jgi:thiol-disulfide isomerase/thioredoxin